MIFFIEKKPDSNLLGNMLFEAKVIFLPLEKVMSLSSCIQGGKHPIAGALKLVNNQATLGNLWSPTRQKFVF